MIKGRNALDSVLEFGIKSDGPLNRGGIGTDTVTPRNESVDIKPIKRNAKPKNVAIPSATVTRPETPVTPTRAMSNAERQKAYRLRKKSPGK